MSFFSSRLWALKEVARSLKKDWALATLSTCLTALALSIPLFVGNLLYDLAAPVRTLPTNAEITVFLEKQAKPEAVAEQLEQFPEVDTVTQIPRDEALSSLYERLGIKDLLKVDNPLPDILVLHMRRDVSSADIDSFLAGLDKNKSIDMTAFDNEWLKKFELIKKATLLTVSCLAAAGSLLVIVVLLIVVRLSTHAIEPVMTTLYFFGASPWFAIRPWALRGALLMGVSGALALGISFAGLTVLRPSLLAVANIYQSALTLHFPDWTWCAGFVLIFAVLGAMTASFSALRIWKRIQRIHCLM